MQSCQQGWAPSPVRASRRQLSSRVPELPGLQLQGYLGRDPSGTSLCPSLPAPVPKVWAEGARGGLRCAPTSSGALSTHLRPEPPSMGAGVRVPVPRCPLWPLRPPRPPTLSYLGPALCESTREGACKLFPGFQKAQRKSRISLLEAPRLNKTLPWLALGWKMWLSQRIRDTNWR